MTVSPIGYIFGGSIILIVFTLVLSIFFPSLWILPLIPLVILIISLLIEGLKRNKKILLYSGLTSFFIALILVAFLLGNFRMTALTEQVEGRNYFCNSDITKIINETKVDKVRFTNLGCVLADEWGRMERTCKPFYIHGKEFACIEIPVCEQLSGGKQSYEKLQTDLTTLELENWANSFSSSTMRSIDTSLLLPLEEVEGVEFCEYIECKTNTDCVGSKAVILNRMGFCDLKTYSCIYDVSLLQNRTTEVSVDLSQDIDEAVQEDKEEIVKPNYLLISIISLSGIGIILFAIYLMRRKR